MHAPKHWRKHIVHPEDGTTGWMRSQWRPMMAWAYMAICIFDFIIAPAATAVLITFWHSSIPPWQSLTLSNGGVMHLAFGAILGVSAWGRTQESISNQTPFGVQTLQQTTNTMTPIKPPPPNQPVID